MTRTPLIAGNWKMYTGRTEAKALARAVAAGAPSDVDIVICPPFPWLIPVAEAISGSRVALGAQNCWTETAGAVTGEVAAAMLTDLCQYVIVGHSERRRLFAESDELVRDKVTAALAAALTPIVCVGEALETRKSGRAVAHVREQVIRALSNCGTNELARIVVAYEPIWAIGTGVAAEPADAAEMARAIRETLRTLAGETAGTARILYGGSVTAANAGEILADDDVDGALVGGASLQPESFLAIANAARR